MIYNSNNSNLERETKLRQLEASFLLNPDKRHEIIQEIVKLIPNDYDLGNYIRQLFKTINHGN